MSRTRTLSLARQHTRDWHAETFPRAPLHPWPRRPHPPRADGLTTEEWWASEAERMRRVVAEIRAQIERGDDRPRSPLLPACASDRPAS